MVKKYKKYSNQEISRKLTHYDFACKILQFPYLQKKLLDFGQDKQDQELGVKTH